MHGNSSASSAYNQHSLAYQANLLLHASLESWLCPRCWVLENTVVHRRAPQFERTLHALKNCIFSLSKKFIPWIWTRAICKHPKCRNHFRKWGKPKRPDVIYMLFEEKLNGVHVIHNLMEQLFGHAEVSPERKNPTQSSGAWAAYHGWICFGEIVAQPTCVHKLSNHQADLVIYSSSASNISLWDSDLESNVESLENCSFLIGYIYVYFEFFAI